MIVISVIQQPKSLKTSLRHRDHINRKSTAGQRPPPSLNSLNWVVKEIGSRHIKYLVFYSHHSWKKTRQIRFLISTITKTYPQYFYDQKCLLLRHFYHKKIFDMLILRPVLFLFYSCRNLEKGLRLLGYLLWKLR